MKLFLLSSISAFLLLYLGCAGRNQARKQSGEPSKKQSIEIQEELDLYTVGGDDWTESWNPELPDLTLNMRPVRVKDGNRFLHDQERNQSGSRRSNTTREVQGYRIQLGNVNVEDEALRVKESALAIFDSVYIHYQSPNYKVRAGDFILRSEADALLDSVKVLFPGAWVVPSRVYDIPATEQDSD